MDDGGGGNDDARYEPEVQVRHAVFTTPRVAMTPNFGVPRRRGVAMPALSDLGAPGWFMPPRECDSLEHTFGFG